MRGFIPTENVIPDLDETEMRKMSVEEAYEMHLDFHKMWTVAVGGSSYRKASWLRLDRRISAIFSDKFGAGWIGRMLESRQRRRS